MRLLLDGGAAVNARSDGGSTALIWAARSSASVADRT
jgi:ankyrin repeat protein